MLAIAGKLASEIAQRKDLSVYKIVLYLSAACAYASVFANLASVGFFEKCKLLSDKDLRKLACS